MFTQEIKFIFGFILIFSFSGFSQSKKDAHKSEGDKLYKPLLKFVNGDPYPEAIDGYKFNNYGASISKKSKAKLLLNSHPDGKIYKTTFNQAYKKSEINFGGRYVVMTYGAGTGVCRGVMVDVETGKIISTPINDKNSYRDCIYEGYLKPDFEMIEMPENVIIKKNSNLLITFTCINKYDSTKKTGKNYIIVSYHKWNGKNFIELGRKKHLVDEY